MSSKNQENVKPMGRRMRVVNWGKSNILYFPKDWMEEIPVGEYDVVGEQVNGSIILRLTPADRSQVTSVAP